MKAHVFGNSPSPAVATYGLRKCVEGADEDVKKYFVKTSMLMMALDSTKEAVDEKNSRSFEETRQLTSS